MIKVGDKLPHAMFKTITAEGVKDVSSEALFEGKRVAVFAVPGAFTPTCTSKHLPGYVKLHKELKAKGIDEVICIAVNDAFVMDAWGSSCSTHGTVTMISDGNGTFTKAIGLEMDGKDYSMGIRSQRYAMVVDKGVVAKMFVEEPGTFEVSSAEYLLAHL